MIKGKRFIIRFRFYVMVRVGGGVYVMLVFLSLGWFWNYCGLIRLRGGKKSCICRRVRKIGIREDYKNKLKFVFVFYSLVLFLWMIYRRSWYLLFWVVYVFVVGFGVIEDLLGLRVVVDLGVVLY